jgi:hypothetical protein
MTAIHGGKAKHDEIDAPKMAVWLRGGLLPQAYVYPAAMRATRDRRRRRRSLTRKRAARLAHIQHTNSQYHLPEMGNKLAATAHRDGGAERCADAAVPKSRDVDLALRECDDPLRSALAWHIVNAAKPHNATTL